MILFTMMILPTCCLWCAEVFQAQPDDEKNEKKEYCNIKRHILVGIFLYEKVWWKMWTIECENIRKKKWKYEMAQPGEEILWKGEKL